MAEQIGYSIALALIAITISIGGILLGLGYALDDKKLKELAKAELITAIINGIILGALIASFSPSGLVSTAISGITNNVSQGYSCPPQMSYNSAICFAYDYVAGVNYVHVYNSTYPTIFDSTVSLLAPLSVAYATLSIVNSMSFSLGLISFGISGAMKPLITGIGYIIDALTVTLVSVEVQGYLLTFISASAMSILMPIGIILRCLYFTRALGGAILAITIGLFAILPMTYVLDASIVNSYTTILTNSSATNILSNATNVQGTLLNAVSAYQSGKTNSTGTLGQINTLLSGFTSSFQHFLSDIANFVAIIIVEAFILPAFSIILTVIAIRELARTLGAEVRLNKFGIL